MKLITFAGPPSSGKTSVLLKLINEINHTSKKAGVIKFDCLYANEAKEFEKIGVPVKIGLSGGNFRSSWDRRGDGQERSSDMDRAFCH